MMPANSLISPILPKWLSTWWGRVLFLGLLLVCQTAAEALGKWNVWESGHAFRILANFLDFIAYLAPVWAVLDDRRSSASPRSPMRGFLLGLFACMTPSLSASIVWSRDFPRYYGLSYFALISALIAGVLFVALADPESIGTNESSAPRWLLSTSGRFALITLMGCVALSWNFALRSVIAMAASSLNATTTYSLELFGMIFVAFQLAAGVFWATFDDRASEQPWSAMLRGCCLTLVISQLAKLLSGLYMMSISPGFWGTRAAEFLGFDTKNVVLCALAALVFILTPIPRNVFTLKSSEAFR